MQRCIAGVLVETIAAERPKFTAPMVLIHGLWCTAAAWRKFMGYFAHRGWTCHALTLRGHGDPVSGARCGGRCADYFEDVQHVIGACDAPPVVVGHDLGGLLALQCERVCASVALAPLVPRGLATQPNRALSSVTARIATRLSWPLPPPGGAIGRDYFGPGVPGGAGRESASVVRELRSGSFELSPHRDVPALVLAGGRDPFCPPADVERLATQTGATFREVPEAGHAMPWEVSWQARVSEIHRWLIQTLGESLLLMRDEEEEA